MLDGASRVGEMFDAAADAGMPACAITDHGVMYGALDFYKQGKAHDVKPILGMEGYLFAPGHRGEKPPQKENGEKTFHLTLLAADNTGYANLVKLSSKAWLEGFHYFPRSDWEILTEHAEGLICLSGCLSAEIPKRMAKLYQKSGQTELAAKTRLEAAELDRLPVELRAEPADRPGEAQAPRLPDHRLREHERRRGTVPARIEHLDARLPLGACDPRVRIHGVVLVLRRRLDHVPPRLRSV